MNNVNGLIRLLTPGYLNDGGWTATGGGFGWPREEGENAYAVATLGKIPILIGRVRGQTMPMACTHYGGCILELLLLTEWRREPKCGELQNGYFCRISTLIPT